MNRIEATLEQVWGSKSLTFCTTCGLPAQLTACNHADHDCSPWQALTAQQRTRVRWQAIQQAKAARARHQVTVAS